MRLYTTTALENLGRCGLKWRLRLATSLAGKIADGLNPFSSGRKKRSYKPKGGSGKPTIEAQDTKGTKTTAQAGDPTKDTTP